MSMQKMFSNSNSDMVNFLHMHLVSVSFPDVILALWWSFQSSGWGFHSGVGSVNSELSVFKVLCQEENIVHIDIFLFHCFGFICGHIYISANMFLHLAFISLICTSTLQLIFQLKFTYVRYYFFIHFLILKTSFVQLQVCISLAVGSPVLSLCLMSYHPKPVPLLTARCA